MIYLNNAATTWPKPECVLRDVILCIQNPPAEEERYGSVNLNHKTVSWSRKIIADFFNVEDFSRIVFTSGATEGLNLILSGLEIRDCHIITTVTEHNSVLRPLHILKKYNNITYLDCDRAGFIDIEDFREKITSETRFAVINHASNVTGAIQDISSIYNICIENDIQMIIDASQSAGSVNIDIGRFSRAFWVFTGHKSLFGISGSGFVYIPENIDLRPLKSGGTGILSQSADMPDLMPLKYEAGTRNIPGIISLGSGIEYLRDRSLQNIIDFKHGLLLELIKGLQKIAGIKLFFAPVDRNAGVVSFILDNHSSEDISDMLNESFGIVTRSGLHCAPMIHGKLGTFDTGLVRISISCLNSVEDISGLLSAVNRISGVKNEDNTI